MSREYIEKEITKIISSEEFPKNMALASAWIIAHFKGVNIKIFDVSQTSSLCDYNIVASAENSTQAKAIVDEIQRQLKQHINVNSLEGLTDCEWVLLDLLDVIVHIFQETTRDVFALEDLWKDSPKVEIPAEYYYGPGEELKPSSDPTENYF